MIATIEVAVLLPLARRFTYLAPSAVAPGARVWVPLAGRRVEGIVLSLGEAEDDQGLRPVAGVVAAPTLTPDQLALAEWVAWYYFAPIGEALRLLLPPGGRASEAQRARLSEEGARVARTLGQALEADALSQLGLRERVLLEMLRDAAARGLSVGTLARRLEGARLALDKLASRGLVERTAAVRVRSRRPQAEDPFAVALPPADVPPSLNPDQQRAYDELTHALAQGGHAAFLLHGVTSSGKTEVYLRVIEDALARGQGALALVPEISLTPQLASRFRARFGAQVAVLHSGLTDRQRFDAWSQLASGRMRIALGARSAAFAPVARLGVVVVDEEHDASFKQEEGVRYHGRDVALWRARQFGCLAVVGSATPSLEILQAARKGRLRLLELPRRATPRPLPEVRVIDLRQHVLAAGMLSAPLWAGLETTLAAGEQAILFLNRRGHSTFVLCRSCGQRFVCPDCSVTLTYHLGQDRLACHYCGHLAPAPHACPACGARPVERLGMGTEKLVAALEARFPHARVARLDRDSAAGQGLEAVLAAMRRGDVDILVGTQMIAKGHDFPGVTLVGVVLADQLWGFPDYRASERAFQMLEQVAGRAGRGERPGRVLVQTYAPEHAAIRHLLDHDFAAFCSEELIGREELAYPPFARLGVVRVDGEDEASVRQLAELAGRSMMANVSQLGKAGLRLLGPAPAPLGRLRGRSRWQLLVKAPDVAGLRRVLAGALSLEVPHGLRLSVDVDPVNVL